MKNELFRIRKAPKGYVVEVKTHKWTLFGLKTIWKPYVKTSGMDCSWHHSSHEWALRGLLDEVKANLISLHD